MVARALRAGCGDSVKNLIAVQVSDGQGATCGDFKTDRIAFCASFVAKSL